jgi:hypothetical protein
MILMAIAVLGAWTVTALAAGFGLGAVIRTADRARKEEFLEALFSAIAEHHTAR